MSKIFLSVNLTDLYNLKFTQGLKSKQKIAKSLGLSVAVFEPVRAIQQDLFALKSKQFHCVPSGAISLSTVQWCVSTPGFAYERENKLGNFRTWWMVPLDTI